MNIDLFRTHICGKLSKLGLHQQNVRRSDQLQKYYTVQNAVITVHSPRSKKVRWEYFVVWDNTVTTPNVDWVYMYYGEGIQVILYLSTTDISFWYIRILKYCM